MNQGFFGFSGVINDLTNIQIQEFDISGKFVIPSFAKRLYVLLIGGGGSGGSGGSQASGTAHSGGGGGSGGRMFVDDFPINIFGPPGTVLDVVIGAGGSSTGGSLGGNGSSGNAGGASSITINGTPGTMILAGGGPGGGGGQPFGSGGSSGGTSWCFGELTSNGGLGGSGSYINYPQGPGGTQLPSGTNGLWNWHSNGGCGGGGLNDSNVAAYGGAITAGGAFTAQYSPRYTSGNNARQPGQPNTATAGDSSFGYTIAGQYSPGLGGVGGGGGATTNGGPGQRGYRGGGGGGGGGALSGFTGGASGAGGNGYCVLIAYG